MSDIEEGRAQTLSNIAELQNIEKEYFSQLNEKVNISIEKDLNRTFPEHFYFENPIM
jgi:hypothetical protein